MTIDLTPVEDAPSSQETSTSESANGTTSKEASVGDDIDGELNISLQSTKIEQTHPPEHSKVSSSVYFSQNQEEPSPDDHTPAHPVPSPVSPQSRDDHTCTCISTHPIPSIDECAVLLSRMMYDNMPYFMDNYEDIVQRHIPHMYKQERTSKTEVVCKSSIVNTCLISYCFLITWRHWVCC